MKNKYAIKRIDGDSVLYYNGSRSWSDSIRKASRYPDTKYFRDTVKSLRNVLSESQILVVEVCIQEGPELIIE